MSLMSIICKTEKTSLADVTAACDVTHVLVLEPGQDLDFPQRPLAVRLVFEGRNFLNGDFVSHDVVKSRSKNMFMSILLMFTYL